MNQRNRWVLLGATSLVVANLSACISLKPPKTHLVQHTPSASLSKLNPARHLHNWQVNGAFSLVAPPQQPVLAHYRWIQSSPNTYSIRISSPLNLFNLSIVGQTQYVTLWQSSKKQVTAATPEQLLKNEMGWHLPVRNLYYWVRGLAAPGKTTSQSDTDGHLIYLQQDPWTVTLSHYTTVNGIDLPEKLMMVSPTVRITMVMKNWIFPQGTVYAINPATRAQIGRRFGRLD